MKLSIRLKFLIVMSGLLLVCLSFYLLMSITVFKSDKTQLVYDLNRSQVSNLASEIETRLSGVDQTLGVFAGLDKKQQEKMIQSVFSKDPDIVAIQVFKKKDNKPESQFVKSEFLETYGLEENNFNSQMVSNLKIPKETIISEGEAIWNGSSEGVPPLMAYGKRVLVLDKNQKPIDQWVLVALLKLDSFLKSVSVVKLSEIKISNSRGDVLVQQKAKELLGRPNIASNNLFEKALNSQSQLSVSRLESNGKGWLTAFGKAYSGKVIVTAQAPEEEVFHVVKALTFRTFLFGSIVLTLVILAAFLLSRSLTRNIQLLSKRMVDAAKGDLSTSIELKGRDETVHLGNAFNQMIFDLKKSRDELEVMNKELDQKVKDRTKELEVQNQKVVEAQEALLRTARLASMGEVAGRTAHEVLNPLTSLLTRAGLTQKRVEVNYQQPLELLDEIGDAWDSDYQDGGFDNLVSNWKEPSEISPDINLFMEDVKNINEIRKNLHEQAKEIAKDMKFIREEGDRIGKIIHGMRRLGNMKSEVKGQNIHTLLTDCSYIMADLFDQQRFSIRKYFNAEVDRVKIDKDEFIQSVTNLMRNSLHSMKEARQVNRDQKGELVLSTRIEGENLVIKISDNGSGISEENQNKLFKVNFTTKSSDEGTGLGLGISRRFIRAYNGDIRFVKSEAMKETSFEILLPLIKDQHGKAVA